jgi:amidase
MSDICFRSAIDLLRLMDEGELTSRKLLELQLARIEKHNNKLNAVIHLDLDQAFARADLADRARAAGERWGPLHGLPMTVKDVHHVAGWPTTYGDPADAHWLAPKNAVLVDRLLDAGAIVFGKTNVPLNSADFQTFNAIHGSTRNPWDMTRSPGGSSGGAATALAAGFTSVELGTDIAGSIRFPAHFCGVYGHKPTHGILTDEANLRHDTFLPTDLSTSGPMARSPHDLELLLGILAGPGDANAKAWQFRLPPARATRLPDFRIGLILTSPLAPIDAAYQDVITQFIGQLEQAGAKIRSDTHPSFDHAEAHQAYVKLLRGTGAGRLSATDFDAAAAAAKTLSDDDNSYAAQLRRAQVQTHRSYIGAEEVRARVKSAWADYFEHYDILLSPVTLSAAYPVNETTIREERRILVSSRLVDYNDQLFWSGYGTLPSLPVTTIPIGTVNGLPVGLNVIGPYLEDLTTLAFARGVASIRSYTTPPDFF